jgi:hypothetical protein
MLDDNTDLLAAGAFTEAAIRNLRMADDCLDPSRRRSLEVDLRQVIILVETLAAAIETERRQDHAPPVSLPGREGERPNRELPKGRGGHEPPHGSPHS